MKTEHEIRKHMKDLLKGSKVPCECGGTNHELKCIVGGRMMATAAGVLAWVLEENFDYDRTVEEMAADLARR